ncbi:MAG TPA: arginine ABC transporter permease [Veillonellaceae bacterium]|jgi:His/Glu/Gln/Arg/opine family amino acid ABC transporter permease subunit|nr:arginine ABC transporter permease [Veillonellaceae bacterium]
MEMIVDTAVKYNHIFLAGVKVTIVISFAACLFGLLLGIILAFMKLSKIKPLVWAANVYVEVIRGTPVLVQISLVFFGLPYIGIHFPSFEFLGVDFGRLSAGILALVINSGAYECEIVRSGIQSIGKGQLEGAMSLGFSKMEAMIRIIIPQAVKNILPVIGNEFVTLIKESSQVSVIGMADLMYTATTVQGISFQPFPPLVIVAAYYFVITFSVSTLLRLMEKKMNIKSARES